VEDEVTEPYDHERHAEQQQGDHEEEPGQVDEERGEGVRQHRRRIEGAQRTPRMTSTSSTTTSSTMRDMRRLYPVMVSLRLCSGLEVSHRLALA
jgi:hypothetical protein